MITKIETWFKRLVAEAISEEVKLVADVKAEISALKTEVAELKTKFKAL